jgi:prepilin-type N-terminal cleavage/methylation domain-containing protein
MKKRGFTLIELLVVIAIIGLLATLAVVAFGNVRKKARDTKRIADMANIEKIILLYKEANGVYPGDNSGEAYHIGCTVGFASTFLADLQTAEYVGNLPMDPLDNVGCWPGALNPNTGYTYVWDLNQTGGDACIAINKLESDWGRDTLLAKYGQMTVASGGGGGFNNAEFNYCYEDETYWP